MEIKTVISVWIERFVILFYQIFLFFGMYINNISIGQRRKENNFRGGYCFIFQKLVDDVVHHRILSYVV